VIGWFVSNELFFYFSWFLYDYSYILFLSVRLLPLKLSLHSRHISPTFPPCLPEQHYTILWPCIHPPSLILLAVVTSHVSLPRCAFQLLVTRFLSYSESWHVRMGPIRCPETSVHNYHTTPCNNPEDHRFRQHRGGSLKSWKKEMLCSINNREFFWQLYGYKLLTFYARRSFTYFT
jgi:hypothetical protein